MNFKKSIKTSDLTISNIVENQSLSFISSLNQKAADLIKEGKDIIKLSGGDPSHVPERLLSILSDLCASSEKSIFNYSPIAGFDKLRELISLIPASYYHNPVTKDNILVSSGGCSGLFLTFKTILNPGDKVLIQDPCWEYLPRLIENCAGIPVYMKFFSSPFLKPNWEDLISEIQNQLKMGVKVVSINSPLNPSGRIIPIDVKNSIIKLCYDYQAWFVSDDVTIDFNYVEDNPKSIKNLENFISVNSFSKNLGITGLRFGFVVACENIINQLKKSQLYTFMYPNSFIQKLIESYLASSKEEYNEFINNIRARYKTYATDYTQMLSAIPEIEVQRPEGGLFLFPKFKSNQPINFDKLLTKYCLAVAPGAAFGSDCESHFRLFMGVSPEQMIRTTHLLSKFVQELQ